MEVDYPSIQDESRNLAGHQINLPPDIKYGVEKKDKFDATSTYPIQLFKAVSFYSVAVLVAVLFFDALLMWYNKILVFQVKNVAVNLESNDESDMHILINLSNVQAQTFLHSFTLEKETACNLAYHSEIEENSPITTIDFSDSFTIHSKKIGAPSGDSVAIRINLRDTNFLRLNAFFKGTSGPLVTPDSQARLSCPLKFSIYMLGLPWALPFHSYNHNEVLYLDAETRARHPESGGAFFTAMNALSSILPRVETTPTHRRLLENARDSYSGAKSGNGFADLNLELSNATCSFPQQPSIGSVKTSLSVDAFLKGISFPVDIYVPEITLAVGDEFAVEGVKGVSGGGGSALTIGMGATTLALGRKVPIRQAINVGLQCTYYGTVSRNCTLPEPLLPFFKGIYSDGKGDLLGTFQGPKNFITSLVGQDHNLLYETLSGETYASPLSSLVDKVSVPVEKRRLQAVAPAPIAPPAANPSQDDDGFYKSANTCFNLLLDRDWILSDGCLKWDVGLATFFFHLNFAHDDPFLSATTDVHWTDPAEPLIAQVDTAVVILDRMTISSQFMVDTHSGYLSEYFRLSVDNTSMVEVDAPAAWSKKGDLYRADFNALRLQVDNSLQVAPDVRLVLLAAPTGYIEMAAGVTVDTSVAPLPGPPLATYFPYPTEHDGIQLTKSRGAVGTTILPSSYSVYFEIKPLSDGVGARSIILLTTDHFSGPGSKVPSVEFSNGDGFSRSTLCLNVRYDGDAGSRSNYRDDGFYLTQPLPIGEWSGVTITVDTVNEMMHIRITGGLELPTMTIPIHPVIYSASAPAPVIRIYAASPWTDAANARIKNVVIAPIAHVPTRYAGLPVTYFPNPAGTRLQQQATQNMVGTIALPAQYVVSFDIYPTANGRGWRNIMHIVGGRDSQGPGGSRLPSVNFCDGTRCPTLGLEVSYWVSDGLSEESSASDSSASGSSAVNEQKVTLATNFELKLHRWSTVTISVDLYYEQMSMSITGPDTMQTRTVSLSTMNWNNTPLTWPSARVYAASDEYTSGDATIRRLSIRQEQPFNNVLLQVDRNVSDRALPIGRCSDARDVLVYGGRVLDMNNLSENDIYRTAYAIPSTEAATATLASWYVYSWSTTNILRVVKMQVTVTEGIAYTLAVSAATKLYGERASFTATISGKTMTVIEKYSGDIQKNMEISIPMLTERAKVIGVVNADDGIFLIDKNIYLTTPTEITGIFDPDNVIAGTITPYKFAEMLSEASDARLISWRTYEGHDILSVFGSIKHDIGDRLYEPQNNVFHTANKVAWNVDEQNVTAITASSNGSVVESVFQWNAHLNMDIRPALTGFMALAIEFNRLYNGSLIDGWSNQLNSSTGLNWDFESDHHGFFIAQGNGSIAQPPVFEWDLEGHVNYNSPNQLHDDDGDDDNDGYDDSLSGKERSRKLLSNDWEDGLKWYELVEHSAVESLDAESENGRHQPFESLPPVNLTQVIRAPKDYSAGFMFKGIVMQSPAVEAKPMHRCEASISMRDIEGRTVTFKKYDEKNISKPMVPSDSMGEYSCMLGLDSCVNEYRYSYPFYIYGKHLGPVTAFCQQKCGEIFSITAALKNSWNSHFKARQDGQPAKLCNKFDENITPEYIQSLAAEQSKDPSFKLQCPIGAVIKSIDFASYGTPAGHCGAFTIGSCHSTDALSVIESACLSRGECSMKLADLGDPCEDTLKWLQIEATCTPSPIGYVSQSDIRYNLELSPSASGYSYGSYPTWDGSIIVSFPTPYEGQCLSNTTTSMLKEAFHESGGVTSQLLFTPSSPAFFGTIDFITLDSLTQGQTQTLRSSNAPAAMTPFNVSMVGNGQFGGSAWDDWFVTMQQQRIMYDDNVVVEIDGLVAVRAQEDGYVMTDLMLDMPPYGPGDSDSAVFDMHNEARWEVNRLSHGHITARSQGVILVPPVTNTDLEASESIFVLKNEMQVLQDLYESFRPLITTTDPTEGPEDVFTSWEFDQDPATGEYLSPACPQEITNSNQYSLSWSNFTDSIVCNGSRVVGLSLSHLTDPTIGTIPSSIGGLQALTYMNFENSQLSGTLPRSIGLLSNLEFIALSRNKLDGTIPTQLGGLHAVTYLDLSYNNFTGTIPSQLGKLATLNLYLSYNLLEGAAPIELCELQNLKILSIRNNSLRCYPSCLTEGILGSQFDLRKDLELKACPSIHNIHSSKRQFLAHRESAETHQLLWDAKSFLTFNPSTARPTQASSSMGDSAKNGNKPAVPATIVS